MYFFRNGHLGFGRNIFISLQQTAPKLYTKMWPILMQMLRRNVPYITLPAAAIVGLIGYNLESLLSDRYTPYTKPVQDQRMERLSDEEELLSDPTKVQKLKYNENVLGKNLSPSLEK